MSRVVRAFRPQPQDVIGVLLGLLVLGAFVAPLLTAWVCGLIVAVWLLLGVSNIVCGLYATWPKAGRP